MWDQILDTPEIPWSNMFLMTCISSFVENNSGMVQKYNLIDSLEFAESLKSMFDLQYDEAKQFFKNVCIFVSHPFN